MFHPGIMLLTIRTPLFIPTLIRPGKFIFIPGLYKCCEITA